MSNTFVVLMIGAGVIAAILLVRHLRRRDAVGYRRRFVNGTPAPAPRSDEAFPYASTLYLGDGGSSSHSHHPQPDCAHVSDGGGSCSDGGGGSSN